MQYLSAFCLELSLILKAGISVTDGLLLLSESENNRNIKALLVKMHNRTDSGISLYDAISETGAFPKYFCDMIKMAELTGRLEMTLSSLAEYYDRKYQLSNNIKTAVVYPLLLGILMLCVVFILITRIVPVFNDLSVQIGVKPSVLAEAMEAAGEFIATYAVYLLLIFLVVFIASFQLAKKVIKRSKIGFQTATVRFSSAMEMIIKSGLDVRDSFEMIKNLADNDEMNSRIDQSVHYLAEGNSLPEAIEKSGIYNPVFNRMLKIGFKTGSLDKIMGEITRRCEELLNDRIEKTVNIIQPVLIVILSLLVGFIMLSVMFPLLDILSFIG